MSDKNYDVAVIGGGPGGYVCAIRCAQLGMSVAVIEKRDALGGTCLNVGCIPSKALLTASEKYHEAKDELDTFGIEGVKPKLNVKKMMKFKDGVINDNTKGIEFLFKKHKIEWIQGHGTIKAVGEISVKPNKGKAKTIKADNIIIATGSEVMPLPNVDIDEKSILSSTGALELEKVPKSLTIIGGGYIGLEMGAVWMRLGAEVTVVEYMDRIMPGMDKDVSKQMQKILSNQGMEFKLKTKVTGVDKKKTLCHITTEPADGGDEEVIKSEKVLVSIGRRPYTDNLGLDDIGVELDDRGRIKTDETFESSVEGVFAIGDVIAGPMLAHKAEEDGVVLAEMLAGQSGAVHYDLVPGVVYTEPEVASIGKTEDQLKDDGVDYAKGQFPFTANGRARSMNVTDGFVKILADKKTDKILGCHIIGHEAGSLIHEIAAVMEFGGSSEDVARICHAHPTLNESVKEAALAVDGRPIHM